MCYYWSSDPVVPERMVAAVEEALNTLEDHPDLLIVGPFGSMFDEWEVPAKARREILRVLSRLSANHLVFETRADTVGLEKMRECASILGGIMSKLKWEWNLLTVGFESIA